MEERIKALQKFLEDEGNLCNLEDINTTYDNVYETPYGEYAVLTDEEATKIHRDDLESLIDDLGIDGLFGFQTWQWDYIIENFLEDNGITDYMREDYEAYFEDIKSESDYRYNLFDNRQMQEVIEMLENNDEISFDLDDILKYLEIKDMSFCELLDDGMLDNYMLDTYSSIKIFLDEYEDNYYDYIEKCIDIIISEYDNPAEWVLLNFGKEGLKHFIDENKFSLDIEGISDWVIEWDGRGASLASYDGQENEIDDFFIYKLN